MVATLHSPNGLATGFVFRRRFTTIVYPASAEDYAADGYKAEFWHEEFTGFSARVMSSPNGAEERALLRAYADFLKASIPETDDDGTVIRPVDQDALQARRDDYFRELAWRVPSWDFATENDGGEVVPVPAPGEHPDNWRAFDLLPAPVTWWLIDHVRQAHMPDPKSPTPAGITGQTTPTMPSPETTPLPPS